MSDRSDTPFNGPIQVSESGGPVQTARYVEYQGNLRHDAVPSYDVTNCKVRQPIGDYDPRYNAEIWVNIGRQEVEKEYLDFDGRIRAFL